MVRVRVSQRSYHSHSNYILNPSYYIILAANSNPVSSISVSEKEGGDITWHKSTIQQTLYKLRLDFFMILDKNVFPKK